MRKKLFFIPAIATTGIAIIAFIFPFKMFIKDALLLEPAVGYGIKVHLVRVLFEPIIGLLLFFKRSLFALDDMINVLIWALLIFIGYSVYKLVIGKVISNKKFVLNQLANLPLIVGLWFAVFVLIIFKEFPNNTIVNKSTHGVLVTTHAHTEFSHDGIITQEGQWEWHKRNGFDAFFITDHANYLKTLQFIAKQQNGEFPKEPFVMAGQEHSGSNHMSLLGLNGKFQTNHYPDSIIVDSVHYYGGAVIINHWFDGGGKAKSFYKELGVDGFEIENLGNDLFYNRIIYKEIKAFCEQNNLIMVGGLDFHGYGRVCGIWNAFEIPKWDSLNFEQKEKAIIDILRNRDQSKLKVLMYIDRPFYDKNSFFSPFITLFYYFRTLNGYQVLSWFFWLSIVSVLRRVYLKKKFTKEWTLPAFGSIGGVFMFTLGLKFHIAQQNVLGYTDVYQEYSNLLLPIGAAFMLYSSLVFYKRFKFRTS